MVCKYSSVPKISCPKSKKSSFVLGFCILDALAVAGVRCCVIM